MATDSKTTPPGTPDISQIGKQLSTHLASADNLAAERVRTLGWIHQARAAQLARTAASLKAQYGANDAGVKSAEAAVAAAKATASRVAAVHQQITTAEPQVARNGWALHGRVFDAQLAPVSGYTVFLVDAAKAYQEAYGFAYTDDTGYFLLNFAGTDASAQNPAQPDAQAAIAPQLFIEITDTNARPVYLSTTAFEPVVGTATYQNITLPAGKHSIGDPPAAIRKVALPRKPKKAT